MLSPELVKGFIKHSDNNIRTFATEYLKDSFSRDTSIINLVLESCDLYPEESENRLMLSNAKYFIQSIDSLARIFNTISKMPLRNVNRIFYESIILHSHIDILKNFANKVDLLESSNRIKFQQRMLISTKSTESLFDELKEFSEENDDKYINEFNYYYGEYIVWELAERKDLSFNYIKSVIQSISSDSYSYFDAFMVTLAGELRIKELIPYLIEFLGSEGDMLNEEASDALSKIGTEEVVDSIATEFLTGSWDFKLFASGVLENIKLPRSEKVLLNLLEKETDLSIKTTIAGGLCKLLSSIAIPKLQKMLPDKYDTSFFTLEELLYINATMNGLNLPEIHQWKNMVDKEEAKLKERVFQLSGISKNKVGRNDLCPCGSGIKYKKCCGKNV